MAYNMHDVNYLPSRIGKSLLLFIVNFIIITKWQSMIKGNLKRILHMHSIQVIIPFATCVFSVQLFISCSTVNKTHTWSLIKFIISSNDYETQHLTSWTLRLSSNYPRSSFKVTNNGSRWHISVSYNILVLICSSNLFTTKTYLCLLFLIDALSNANLVHLMHIF